MRESGRQLGQPALQRAGREAAGSTLLKLVPFSQSSWLPALLASTLRGALRGFTKPRLSSAACAP